MHSHRPYPLLVAMLVIVSSQYCQVFIRSRQNPSSTNEITAMKIVTFQKSSDTRATHQCSTIKLRIRESFIRMMETLLKKCANRQIYVHRRAAWKSSLEELSEATKVLGYTSLKIYLIVINHFMRGSGCVCM